MLYLLEIYQFIFCYIQYRFTYQICNICNLDGIMDNIHPWTPISFLKLQHKWKKDTAVFNELCPYVQEAKFHIYRTNMELPIMKFKHRTLIMMMTAKKSNTNLWYFKAANHCCIVKQKWMLVLTQHYNHLKLMDASLTSTNYFKVVHPHCSIK